MTTFHRSIAAGLIAALALAGPASAQSPSESPWRHGTTLSGFAGVGADSDRTGSAFGGALGWELTPKLGIEGSGAWFERGDGAESFGAALRVRAALFGRDKAAPFVTAGVGAYRASYSSRSADMPRFHRDRLPETMGPRRRSTFIDPALVFGGGLNIFLTRHIAVRPDVEAMVVMRDSQRHVVTTVGVHVAFHFEDHPVTPSRGR